MTLCACVSNPPSGLVGLVALPVAGLVGGAVQIGRGVYNTPEAIREKMDGKVWNKVRCTGIHCDLHAVAVSVHVQEAQARVAAHGPWCTCMQQSHLTTAQAVSRPFLC